MKRKLRFGIVGTANIARKNWRAIALTGNATVAGVASRDLNRAAQFVAECSSEHPMERPPIPFGSYADLIESPDIDAVYIPLPTGVRKEWVIRAARARKHVVCEKPCAVSLGDLQEMVAICEQSGVQFMDGVMFMHGLRLEALRRELDSGGRIGAVRRITSAFGFLAEPDFFRANIRASRGLEPDGCLGDLGWYCIRFSLWVMKGQMPVEVRGRILSDEGSPGIPTDFSGELLFDAGVSAGFHASFRTHDQQWAVISGEKGILQVQDFVLPFAGNETRYSITQSQFSVQGCEFRMEARPEIVRVSEGSHGTEDAQEVRMFRQFSAQVLGGTLNPEWPRIALQTQEVMEKCLRSAREAV